MKRRTISLPEHLDERVSREAHRRLLSAGEPARQALEGTLSTGDQADVPARFAAGCGPGDTVERIDDLMAEGFGDLARH